jgi:hypothetical protein
MVLLIVNELCTEQLLLQRSCRSYHVHLQSLVIARISDLPSLDDGCDKVPFQVLSTADHLRQSYALMCESARCCMPVSDVLLLLLVSR